MQTQAWGTRPHERSAIAVTMMSMAGTLSSVEQCWEGQKGTGLTNANEELTCISLMKSSIAPALCLGNSDNSRDIKIKSRNKTYAHRWKCT